MSISKKELRNRVVEALQQTIERADGRHLGSEELGSGVRPIEDLGLDSVTGVGFLCDLEVLGIRVGDDHNPFVHDEECRGRSIDEIVEFLSELPEVKEVVNE